MKKLDGNIKKKIILYLDGILFSYSQVFFSKKRSLAFLLLIVTFFDWSGGFSGLIAVLTANTSAITIGFRRHNVSQGVYGFNSLLVGLGLGMLYEPSVVFIFVLVFAALFTFFLTIWLEGFLGKYGLPYLSLPFLFGIWIVSLAARQFTDLDLSERNVFILNEMYRYGGLFMVNLYLWLNELHIPVSITGYFKSLATIFFQYQLLAGVLIAIGLLICSRIAFLLSVTGFFSAYFYHLLIGANIEDLNYSYIGFNFILSAIAIGGFFIIPSWASFLWVFLLTPLISFIVHSSAALFALVHLPVFSLAFNITVILFLYVLKFRERNFRIPELVTVQQFSPESNLYSQKNFQQRFNSAAPARMFAPFIGEWTVTQAHNGAHTHRDDWRHAWDFEILDDKGMKFSENGTELSNYYSFGKPVIAPADGIVQEIHDGIEDNKPGEINIANNWGNTIIIKHSEKLYSKLCHLKNGSFKVVKGAYVKRGDLISSTGNSGRSPVPHLHFQIQTDPFIGSKTTDYPLAAYLLKTEDGFRLKTYKRPIEKEVICNLTNTETLRKAFNFIPGQRIRFAVAQANSQETIIDWEVKSDMFNYTFLECSASESRAWFTNEAGLFFFTHFDGSKKSLLYYFYLTTYIVPLGYARNLQADDLLPHNAFRRSFLSYLHDFIAPFRILMHGRFKLRFVAFEDDFTSGAVSIKTTASLIVLTTETRKVESHLEIKNGRIESMDIVDGTFTIHARELPV